MSNLCNMRGKVIEPCAALDKVLEDRHKKGLVLVEIYDRTLTLTRTIVVAKNGEFRANGLTCRFCPFCGCIIFRDED